MDLTDEDIRAASERGDARRRAGPLAVSARYDRGRGRIVVALSIGLEVMFSPSDAEGLAGAKAGQLAEVQVREGGLALYFPGLDADFSVPALMEGRLGSDRWMMARGKRPAA